LNTARSYGGGAGTKTAALAFGGIAQPPTNPNLANTESYNGSTWTEVNDLNTAKRFMAGVGADNTSALAFGAANSPSTFSLTESWNGTSWFEVNDFKYCNK